ncbi:MULTISPECIES: L,D-transpeptidase [unclassified Butyrivibrio]|uniref:L,D-transpeptidase n=1 Tax=unclassified Butyrivibrio TaxID=2639466 RepID=UPI0003B47A2D|nr:MULTISPECIES: L,D-transpeptidase [unclassified Butyrivibrio]MDC7294777.1 L,D-transpeptidase [Butyrivibrio sp. DSM 10294]
MKKHTLKRVKKYDRAKAVKAVMAVAVGFFMMLSVSITSRASGFDPEYYARKYPDVVNAVGSSTSALVNHYINFGIYEGRFQNEEEEKAGTPLNTYVDVDIENQTVTFVQDGVPILSTPCVTGDLSQNRGTPTGIYAVYGHVRGKWLTGPTWHSWVEYWMPFTKGGCGLHDANWRSKFGGEIYKTAGSHGCVNLPPEIAAQFFELAQIGTVVKVH